MGGGIVGGYRNGNGILLPGHVVAVLLDQHDVSCDDGRDKMRLAGASLVHFAHPRVHPIVLLAAIAAVGIVQIRTILIKCGGLVSTRPQAGRTTQEMQPNSRTGMDRLRLSSAPAVWQQNGDQDSDRAERTFCTRGS